MSYSQAEMDEIELRALREENQRLRKALEFYANPSSGFGWQEKMRGHSGETARAALNPKQSHRTGIEGA